MFADVSGIAAALLQCNAMRHFFLYGSVTEVLMVQDGCEMMVQKLHRQLLTTRANKLSEMFMEVVPDRKASTLLPRIEDLASGGRTRIWTDGARHNIRVGGRYKWNSVNHRREWIAEEGVHTNTVECANSVAKKGLNGEGNVLGRKKDKRADGVQANAEKCNDSLRCNGIRRCNAAHPTESTRSLSLYSFVSLVQVFKSKTRSGKC